MGNDLVFVNVHYNVLVIEKCSTKSTGETPFEASMGIIKHRSEWMSRYRCEEGLRMLP